MAIDNLNPFSGIFDASDPNVNSQLRQRIAMAMLARQKRYPKTFGEGLAAIGESLGDIGMQRKLEQQDLAQQAAARNYGAAGPQAEAPTETKTAYAPPADVAPAEPAAPVEPAAPNMLAQLPTATETVPGDMTTAAAQPSTMLDPNPMLSTRIQTPPAGRFTPREAIARTLAAQRAKPQGFDVAPGAVREQGDYNEIDASAGMKRVTPGYMQDAIARQTDDPDMRAYLGSLSAGEAKNARDVSSTGAAGPFQFTRGTARQYGLTDPTNLDASASAALDLTQDNAAAFRKINGREPTMADLALMHQQGGVTGSRMVAGTGNAPAANLAVNNVSPNASAAAAVNKIKGYYGLPERTIDDTGRTTLEGPGPQRDAVTAQLMPKPPVMAFDGQPSPAQVPPPALAPTQTIRQAPPAAAPIAQAPPQTTPYEMQKPVPPVAPRPLPISKEEYDLTLKTQSNPYFAPHLAAVQKARTDADAHNNEEYKARYQHFNTLDTKYQDWLAGREEREQKRTLAPYTVRKTAAETADLEAKAEAGRVPTTRKLNDSDVQWDPKAIDPKTGKPGSWIKPPGDVGTASPETTEAQSKDIGAYERGRRALYNIGKGEALHNWVDYGASYISSSLPSKEFQLQYNAAREFASIALRKETGQGANASEIKDVIARYFPKPGAAPEVVAQMAQAREAVFEAIKDGIGGKHKPILDKFDAKFAEEQKLIEAAKAKAAADGNPATKVKDAAAMLPPTIINSKAERDALPRGRRYRLPSDPPDSPPRVKTEHDDRH